MRWLKHIVTGCVVVLWTANIGFCQKSYDYIDITNPFLRKVPIAVPVFKSLTPSAQEHAFCREASDLLAETLKFTGYFNLMDREAFLEDPSRSGIIAPNIEFKNWTVIGAELLVTAGVMITSGILEMELRLYDTLDQKLIVGKRYTGRPQDQRNIVRRFCSEVIFHLTGDRGIFTSKIAFESTGTGHKEIYACDFDGFSPEQVTRTGAITMSPAWSSDGQWLAYTSYAKGNPDLYIRHLKDNRGAVVAKEGINISPAWVPGQFVLAAALSFARDSDIYLLTGEGKIIKRLTNSRGIDVSPSWSPDGKRMAFVSNRSGSPQIYIKEIDTGLERRLTFDGRYNTSPSWAPKGNKIAYAAQQDGVFDIRVIGAEGGGAVQLTRDAGNNEGPSWSPDGSLLAFASTREGVSRIYVMTAFGTDQRRLLTLPGEQTNPRWSSNTVP